MALVSAQLIQALQKVTSDEANTGTRAAADKILESILSLSLEEREALSSHVQSAWKSNENVPKNERCLDGYQLKPIPNSTAPDNVFSFLNSDGNIIGWRNFYQLPVEYDLEIKTGIFDTSFQSLAQKLLPTNGPHRRFLVIDNAVEALYGRQILRYFDSHGMKTKVLVIEGEEVKKRWQAVDQILEACCVFGLQRREPIIAIGGGCVLDIVGLAANLYRRGVPYIRVPTTLLAIVDASVGVKNGVDYCSCSRGPQKNRVGSFYAPAAVYLDKSFIATQNRRNIIKGVGEIMKLALVRSIELFELLENHGNRLILEKFQGNDDVADKVIEKSIEIMLEELGPNLWEHKLERCVDYGHTFSKIIEMQPNADIMHGEAVNIDGFLCVIISHQRRMITSQTRDRIFTVMQQVGLPTNCDYCTLNILEQGLIDAVEHRHGAQRIPLINAIGSSVCVNDITKDELKHALVELESMHSLDRIKPSC
jgi:3-dehydroquinate synthase